MPWPSQPVLATVLSLLVVVVSDGFSDISQTVGALQLDTLVAIPVGARESDIGSTLREKGGGCSIGFAFMDSQGDLYIYDYSHANLKHIVARGLAKASVSILPGVRTEHINERPMDGAVGDDDTIVLLTDTGRTRDRYRLHFRGPTDEQWTATDYFDEPHVGYGDVRGRSVTASNSARLALVASGDVVLFQAGRLLKPGVIVFSRGRVVPQSVRKTVEPSVFQTSRETDLRVRNQARPSASWALGPEERTMNAEFLGADAAGRRYYIALRPGPPFSLEAYGASGVMLARRPFVEAIQRCQLDGRGRKFVRSDGTVLVIQALESQLAVIAYRL